MNTYGGETGVEYAASITQFSPGHSCYLSTLGNGLLDVLLYGEHRKLIAILADKQRVHGSD